MSSAIYTKTLIYLGIIFFIASVFLNFAGLLSYEISQALHVFVFVIALWYLVWHFKITKGHRASYDRISEGMVLLMIIYNPFKPFILELAVWMFLDFIFLWVFMLYLSEIKDIERNLSEGLQNWSKIGEDLI